MVEAVAVAASTKLRRFIPCCFVMIVTVSELNSLVSTLCQFGLAPSLVLAKGATTVITVIKTEVDYVEH